MTYEQKIKILQCCGEEIYYHKAGNPPRLVIDSIVRNERWSEVDNPNNFYHTGAAQKKAHELIDLMFYVWYDMADGGKDKWIASHQKLIKGYVPAEGEEEEEEEDLLEEVSNYEKTLRIEKTLDQKTQSSTEKPENKSCQLW